MPRVKNRSFLILAGSLSLGIACASIAWLIFVPHPHGVSDADARKMGYQNEANREHVHALLHVAKLIDSADLDAAEKILRGTDVRAKTHTIVILGSKLCKPELEPRKRKILLAQCNDANEQVRFATALVLPKLNDPQADLALKNMRNDSSEEIRKIAMQVKP